MRINFRSDGQGLVEYALILMLAVIPVVMALTLIGPQIGEVFSQITEAFADSGGGSGGNDIVVVTKAEYDSGEEELHLDVTSDGDYDPAVTLTASPGGVMEERSDHYHLEYPLTGCPCTVTVTSSSGGSATVTVGP